MGSPISGLGLTVPVLAAPMAGGPGTPALVSAAGRAGSIGFLAAGYKTPQAMAEEIAEVRAAGVPFGVNLFAPNPVPVDPGEFRHYAQALQAEAGRYGLDLAGAEPVEDDDAWTGKVGLLLADPVPVVSFTFGVPDTSVIHGLRRAGTVTVQTVTSAAEARLAAEAGVDALVVQGPAAGAHSGTLTPEKAPEPVPLPGLVADVRASTSLPLVAAGGLGTAADVAAVLRAGAVAAMAGTVLLRSDESGASAVHRAALADAALAGTGRTGTVLTRAFTGRPARGLRNRFIDRYGARAPLGYPAVHYLTSPLRKAAAAAGDPELVNLWAGAGYRHATAAPAASILARLAEEA